MATTHVITTDAVWPAITLPEPVIVGVPDVGETLTCVAPGFTTFQWRRAGVAIAGATDADYVVVSGDAGSVLSVLIGNDQLTATIPALPVEEDPDPIVVEGIWDLLPGSQRARGVNIGMRNGPGAGGSRFNPECWAELWKDWEFTAPGAPGAPGNWIKPQLDQAVDLGINLVHLLGSQYVREGSGSAHPDPIDLETYLDHWVELLDYVRELGLYAYVGFGGDSMICDFGAQYGYIPSHDWLIDEYVAHTEMWRQYQDIIVGVDLSTEANTWASIQGNSQPVYDAVKATAPDLKFTWSKAIFGAPSGPSQLAPASVLDYYDVHVYYSPAATDLDNLLVVGGLPVMIGEFGVPASMSSIGRQQFFSNVNQVASRVNAGRHIAGAQVWSMYDQDIVADGQYGLCTATGVVRPDTTSIFQTFPN